jgi:hypothetical protein
MCTPNLKEFKHMVGIVTLIRVCLVVTVTSIMAAGAWLRNRFESLLLLLPARPNDRPSLRARVALLSFAGRSDIVTTK